MATGRPQGGMNSRNHHDSLGQSGQRRGNQTPKPPRNGSGGGGNNRPFGSTVIKSVFGPGPKVSGHGPGKRKK